MMDMEVFKPVVTMLVAEGRNEEREREREREREKGSAGSRNEGRRLVFSSILNPKLSTPEP
jgi:CRISPR/Cas system-associated endonuclease Cas1